jgi:hypothetical protein
VQGEWNFTRTVEHKPESVTSTAGRWTLDGALEGKARLHPRTATAPGARDAAEYLYKEEGTWNRVDGSTLSCTGCCVLNLDRDVFTVWTAKDDGGAGDLFQTPLFYVSNDPSHGWLAGITRRDKDCEYNTTYEFRCKGSKVTTWRILHEVMTQDMTYKHQTIYLRPDPEKEQRGECSA